MLVEFGFWQFKCDKCDFATHFEAGLKSHAGKKHKKGMDNAEIVFLSNVLYVMKFWENNKEIKIHMRTHSYKLA